MLGAIIGDIIGSVYEFQNKKQKNFPLFTPMSRFTDDTVMTLAVAKWLTEDKEHSKEGLVQRMQSLGKRYPNAGYGGGFKRWLNDCHPKPYNSYGNGSAMRVSPIAFYAQSLEETLRLATISAEVTHNHPEGIKGAKAIAAATYLARTGATKAEIKAYIEEDYKYNLNQQLDNIWPALTTDLTCQKTVPAAILAFLKGEDFEDVIRIAVSLGGDSDTIAAMAGSIAQAFYGLPQRLATYCYALLTPYLRTILNKFEESIGILAPDPFDIERFIKAQNADNTYQRALEEMQRGHKTSHWIWFIFPQLKGLGHSRYSQYYGLADADETRTFLANSCLNKRLREITCTLLTHKDKNIEQLMGSYVDALKLKSSMTLFDAISPNDIFSEVLKTFYNGEKDHNTIKKIG
jgi:ADP-ribosylglycohydrolase family protein